MSLCVYVCLLLSRALYSPIQSENLFDHLANYEKYIIYYCDSYDRNEIVENDIIEFLDELMIYLQFFKVKLTREVMRHF